jgi:GNAT superfamily N-acetyltransferase
MPIVAVDQTNVADLIRYCAEHGSEHDDSYLPGPGFTPSAQQPSYLLVEDGAVVGAVSLMRTRRYEASRRARFAIFHAVSGSAAAYAGLFDAIRPHVDGLRGVYLFIPDDRRQAAAALEGLGFAVARYSFVLVNRQPHPYEVRFPAGFTVASLRPADAEGIRQFTRCVNENFAELAGHTDLSPGEVRGWFDEAGYLEQGIFLLRKDGEAAGTLCVMREYADSQTAEVIALSVARRYRGRGLGRRLLRFANAFAVRRGFSAVILSVNAENRSALCLYRSEGFDLVETVACYALDLT